ncbi:hypothetical protein [Janthinobacterium sp. GW458P]|uniref:hypothetical protein n=1 Tax=Janthinobacterium sp. GW458P TaxID=1981504 RepID=UPI000A326039|nr:hypothetical protein [Janthinobacterium sp. GW458P]MBE3024687.1 hypothetical protein [Janthinobacterium sp. GW458P]PHV18002.1 hypothetical protein CSQ90_06775 [Janthinobacterium sp. BJB303]
MLGHGLAVLAIVAVAALASRRFSPARTVLGPLDVVRALRRRLGWPIVAVCVAILYGWTLYGLRRVRA